MHLQKETKTEFANSLQAPLTHLLHPSAQQAKILNSQLSTLNSQFAKRFLSFYIVLPKQGELDTFRDALVFAELLNVATVFLEVGEEVVEGTACLEDGGEILGVALEEELEGSEVVKEAASTHHTLEFCVGKIFVEHEEVVAEVEEGLARIALIEGGSSEVVRLTLADADNALAHRAESPAKVYLFHVGKETGIESPTLTPVGGSHHEGGSCAP